MIKEWLATLLREPSLNGSLGVLGTNFPPTSSFHACIVSYH